MSRQKLAQHEVNLLAGALRDTLRSELKNYIDNLTEIKKLIDTEKAQYPNKMRRTFLEYHQIIDGVSVDLKNLYEKADDLTEYLPTAQAWSYSDVSISGEDFKTFLDEAGLASIAKKKGDLYLWTSDHIFLYASQDPRRSGGLAGSIYFVGDEASIKQAVTHLLRYVDLEGEDRNDTVPLP
jgi:hypothetical protein